MNNKGNRWVDCGECPSRHEIIGSRDVCLVHPLTPPSMASVRETPPESLWTRKTGDVPYIVPRVQRGRGANSRVLVISLRTVLLLCPVAAIHHFAPEQSA